MTSDSRRSVAEARSLLNEACESRLRRRIAEFSDDPRPGVVMAVESARRRLARDEAESGRLDALYAMEATLSGAGFFVVAGVDEVGRGALAGPLTAGACVLPLTPRIEGLNDSKRLSPGKRRMVAERIREVAVCFSVAHVPAEEVDAHGVTASLRHAMRMALSELDPDPDHVIVDGLPMGVREDETAVVGGDGIVAAIAAASILAKVERDDLMVTYSLEYPEYGFEINKGYGTPEHLSAISRYGRTPLHRVSFCSGRGMDPLF